MEDRSTLFLAFWAATIFAMQVFALVLLLDRDIRRDFARHITRSQQHPLHRPLMLGQRIDEERTTGTFS